MNAGPSRTVAAAACAALFLLFTTPAPAAGRQVIKGHVPAAVARLQPLSRLGSAEHLDLAIALPLRNREALTNLLQQLYDPASPNYRQYLTPEQFAERFGPTEQDYQAVIAFAKSKGLVVTGTHPNRTLVDVNGSVGDIEKTLHVNMRVYRHPTEARDFHAPDAEPSLDLAVPILAISGLDDFNLPHPMNLRMIPLDEALSATPYATGSGPRGYFIGRDFRAAYAPGVALDGSGQSVGLFEMTGYYASDITAYENLAGLPSVSLSNVLVKSFNGTPSSANLEVALDIQMVISMAPGLSKVFVYEGVSTTSVLNRMATDNAAKQLSSSWSFGNSVDAARDQVFQQFAAQGQSMFQSSGDYGAWVGGVAPPSDNPYLTVVGGTSLTTSGPGGPWSSETTWSGSGGGISTAYAIPTWQQGLDMSASHGSTTMRNIPDVAGIAEPSIWFVANHGEQGVVGGTSAAAPMWAGFAALVNQQAAAEGKPPIGFINWAIYAIGQRSVCSTAFHDITTGNNTNSTSPSQFFAVPGYDLCTGWGTPTGSNLIQALITPPDSLQITPATPFLISGPDAGPFNPATQSYSLTNLGATPLNWTLVNTSSWLNASPTGGTLTGGGPGTNVTLSLNAAASNLVAGAYSATVWFTNLNATPGFTNQVGQSRQVSLGVASPPVITSQPVNQTVLQGATATFVVGASSNAVLFYQWQQDNGMYVTNLTDAGNVSGSATGTLTISNVAPANVGAYSVIVTNPAGTVSSSSAFLAIVPWRPVITVQPASQTTLPGATATFTVGAVGSQPLFYRWQQSGTNLAEGGNLSGTTTSTLAISNVSSANAGTYSVLVSNALGSVTSSGAVMTVVSLTPPGIAQATLYAFGGGNDGAIPNGLVCGPNGGFLGTAQSGGINSSGTVFQITGDGTFTGVYSFTGGSDGALPRAALLQGSDGNYYGTTSQGGSSANGTVFKVSAGGALTPLVSFNGTNGANPRSPLVQGADGNFYGTTYVGGTYSDGVVFQMTPSGGLTALYSFTGGGDGAYPAAGLVRATDGYFYGTTYKGGTNGNGTVFRISTNGTLATLVSFNYTNGGYPLAELIQGTDGNFYGTTIGGRLRQWHGVQNDSGGCAHHASLVLLRLRWRFSLRGISAKQRWQLLWHDRLWRREQRRHGVQDGSRWLTGYPRPV